MTHHEDRAVAPRVFLAVVAAVLRGVRAALARGTRLRLLADLRGARVSAHRQRKAHVTELQNRLRLTRVERDQERRASTPHGSAVLALVSRDASLASHLGVAGAGRHVRVERAFVVLTAPAQLRGARRSAAGRGSLAEGFALRARRVRARLRTSPAVEHGRSPTADQHAPSFHSQHCWDSQAFWSRLLKWSPVSQKTSPLTSPASPMRPLAHSGSAEPLQSTALWGATRGARSLAAARASQLW